MRKQETRAPRREQGAALLVAIIMLSLITLLGMSSMQTVMHDRQVAGFQSRARTALYAADAGISWGQGIIYQQIGSLASEGVAALYDFDPAFPTAGAPRLLGDGSATQPRFMRDTDPGVTQALDYLGKARSCVDWVMSDEYGSAQWREALFDIRVEGRPPGSGSAARHIQAVTTYCYPFH